MAIDVKISHSYIKSSNDLIDNSTNKQVKTSETDKAKLNSLGSNHIKSINQNFSQTISKIYAQKLDGELKEVINKIKIIGQTFFRSPSEKTLNEFKYAIKYFLKRVSKELFMLKEELGAKKEGKQKVYQLIEILDHETNKLTRETFLTDKAIILLSSLDEIRGLVIDLIS